MLFIQKLFSILCMIYSFGIRCSVHANKMGSEKKTQNVIYEMNRMGRERKVPFIHKWNRILHGIALQVNYNRVLYKSMMVQTTIKPSECAHSNAYKTKTRETINRSNEIFAQCTKMCHFKRLA